MKPDRYDEKWRQICIRREFYSSWYSKEFIELIKLNCHKNIGYAYEYLLLCIYHKMLVGVEWSGGELNENISKLFKKGELTWIQKLKNQLR